MWKRDWEQCRTRHERWWAGEGLVLAAWGTGLRIPGEPREAAPVETREMDPVSYWRDPVGVATRIRADMAGRLWPADMLPVAWPDIGTVCLAAYLGAVPEYTPTNVWYRPAGTNLDRPLEFDPQHPEVVRLEAVVSESVARANGDYLIGMPAVIPNMDVLAELRGANELMYDLVDRPGWVLEKLDEIRAAWEAAWERLYAIIRDPDGGMAFGYFMLWGPGRTGLLQCDVSATFSPQMFETYVMPGLERECAFLDHSMYHLDGHQCIPHLELVLSLDRLDAVEWTPDPQVPSGGNPCWFPMYRRIRDAGKSLWVANARPDELQPLLEAVGADGLYVTIQGGSVEELERAAEIADRYR